MTILSIDPGNIESAFCLIDMETYRPIEFGKIENRILLEYIEEKALDIEFLVIEMIASYGMAVGKTVFDTCVWIGRFIQEYSSMLYIPNYAYIYRQEEKMNLCNSMRAKDSNIRQALIDRFGEVGTKNNKGWFYGFKKDIWAAYAVGVTFLDKQQKRIEKVYSDERNNNN